MKYYSEIANQMRNFGIKASQLQCSRIDITDRAYNSLRGYLYHQIKGNDIDYRTPYFKKSDREDILLDWMYRIADMLSADRKFWGLLDFENDMYSKCGPMSIMKPFVHRCDSVADYYTLGSKNNTKISDDVLRVVIHNPKFKGFNGIRIKDPESTLNDMVKNTNSGLPYFTRRGKVAEKTLNDAYRLLRLSDREYIHEIARLPAIVGWRGQEGGPLDDDVKQRVIFMMPFVINLLESQFYQPFIKAAQTLGAIPAWISQEAVDQEVTNLFDSKPAEDVVVCTDFTKFDQHFGPIMQSLAHMTYKMALTPNDASGKWLRDTYVLKYCIPLIVPGLILEGAHGMASGSGGTNCDETVAHSHLQFLAAKNHHTTLNRFSQCNGDDGILTFPGITANYVQDFYTKFGLESNVTKYHVSKTSAVYLRAFYDTNLREKGVMVGMRSTVRALNRIISLERYYNPKKWDKRLLTLRTLSILETCKWNICFHKLIDYVMAGDEYRLGLDIQGFYDHIADEWSRAKRLWPSLFGWRSRTMKHEKGIKDWFVVKYILSKYK